MPECQIEAILLHELAHVLRRDYLVNLIQTVVEGFLFYHPAVWWISSAIRAERENCCDDMVVSAGTDAREYAGALTTLEQDRQTLQEAVLAATGGSLLKRIRRLLRTSDNARKFTLLGAPGPVLSAGVVLVTATLAFMAWPAISPPAHAQVSQPQISDPWQKWLSEDVTYIITDAERNAFRQLTTDDERAHFVEQFWLRRDPTPSTRENEFKDDYYRRIGFANGRFTSQSRVPGWRTDRGRIYITFGPPDEIDSHPAANGGQTPA
jgi:GWxTD domain-containing protein